MTAPLTPETLAELRELASNAPGEPYGCTLADKAISALPALLDAAEELERVKKWANGRCSMCASRRVYPCSSCPSGQKWKPVWNEEAAK